jgi:hypothetical protein
MENGVKKSSHSRIRRPQNRTCTVCGRKAISPEKSDGKWYFRSTQKCTNCIMLENNYFNEISKRKGILPKSVKESEAAFPLLVLDVTKNELIGKFDDPKVLRKKLNFYRAENLNSKILIIDTKFRDFTEYFNIPIT